MKRKKLNGTFNTLILLILFITVSYISITLFSESYATRFYIPDFNNENIKVLKSLDFTDEDIKIISEYVSEKNIAYLVDNNINKELVMNLIKTK